MLFRSVRGGREQPRALVLVLEPALGRVLRREDRLEESVERDRVELKQVSVRAERQSQLLVVCGGDARLELAKGRKVRDESLGLRSDLVPHGVELPPHEAVKVLEQRVLDRQVLDLELRERTESAYEL